MTSRETALALIVYCVVASASYVAMEIYTGFWPDGVK